MSTPLRFKELQIRNFLSFGNQLVSIDLSNIGSTLIQGENIDASSNNGAGKTTIINALCYSLYNKPFDSISLQKLINQTNNSKNTLMEVRLVFEKGNDEFEVYRCRGENFTIQIMMNGEDVTLDSVAENDKFIEEIIGMSYELFTKIIIFSGNSTPFLLMPVSQQRNQIEELFNITLLTEKALVLKEKIRQSEADINVQEAIIKQQVNAVKLYDQQLASARQRVEQWESNRNNTVSALKRAMEAFQPIDMEAEKALHEQIEELRGIITKTTANISVLSSDKIATDNKIKDIERQITHLLDAKCPYCLQSFADADADAKIAEIQAGYELSLSKAAEINDKLQKFKTEQSEAESLLADLRAKARYPSYAAAVSAQAEAATAQQRIDEQLNAQNPHIDALTDLEQHAAAPVGYDDLNALKKELEHQQFLLKLLTDKNSFIRRKIINKTIPFLNSRLVHYTRELGLPHIVKFDDDMSCTVSEYGRELDFGNLSSGEKKRVNLSLSLAFRDVLHHLHARVNCLFIDEIDASLDGSGVENVFKLLKQKTRDEGLGLWIISHRPEAVGRFDRVVIVRKENGFSRILDEDGEELGVT